MKTCINAILLFLLIFSLSCQRSVLSFPDTSKTEDPVVSEESSENNEPSDDNEETAFTSLASADWDVLWTGSGYALFDNNEIVMEPLASTQPAETHSVLLSWNKPTDCDMSDFTITITATTEEQIRTPTPNTWEAFWVFFNFTYDDALSEHTNYFILKTNGIELGTSDDVTGQEFLFTASDPKLVVGTSQEYTLEKTGQLLSVKINGTQVLSYNGNVEDIPLIDQDGTIGLYTEDARVRIEAIAIESPDCLF